jgi:mono/diheme cytochrome c family protein
MKTPRIVLIIPAATAVAGVAGTYAFVTSGLYDISATIPDSNLVYWATHQMMEHSVARRLGTNVLPGGREAPQRIAAGGQIFVANCAVCRGRPGIAPNAISQGLNPTPPDLFRTTRAPDPQENFQFIKHGVKMTGMPAFGPTMADDQLWAVVAFVNLLPGISVTDFDTAVAQPGAAPAVTATPSQPLPLGPPQDGG